MFALSTRNADVDKFFQMLLSRCLNDGQLGLSSESEKKLFQAVSIANKRAGVKGIELVAVVDQPIGENT